MPNACRRVIVYADTRDQYTTFISPEASKWLDEYLDERVQKGELIDSETSVFVSDWNPTKLKKPQGMKLQGLIQLMFRIARKAKTQRVKESDKRFNIMSAPLVNFSPVTASILSIVVSSILHCIKSSS